MFEQRKQETCFHGGVHGFPLLCKSNMLRWEMTFLQLEMEPEWMNTSFWMNHPNKQTNKLNLVIRLSDSLSTSTLVHVSHDSVPRPLPAPRSISKDLKTDWLNDMSIKQLKMTVGAWSKTSGARRAELDKRELDTAAWPICLVRPAFLRLQLFGISMNKPAILLFCKILLVMDSLILIVLNVTNTSPFWPRSSTKDPRSTKKPNILEQGFLYETLLQWI